MAEPLASFTIEVPRYSRAFLPVDPYEDQPSRLKQLIPKEHFILRLSVLQKLTRRKFPSPYWDMAFTATVTLAVLSFAAVFFASFAGRIPVWYSICVVGSLLMISGAYGIRARKGMNLLSAFQTVVAQELGSFTATDLPKYNVRWALTERQRRFEEATPSAAPIFTISIFEYDPDFDVEELPAYVNARDYVQPVIVEVQPPSYELSDMQRERLEQFVAGEPEESESVGEGGAGASRSGRRGVDEVLTIESRPMWASPLIIDYASGEIQVLASPTTEQRPSIDAPELPSSTPPDPPQYELVVSENRDSPALPNPRPPSPPLPPLPVDDDDAESLP